MLKKLLLLVVFAGILVVPYACKVTNDEDTAVDVDPVFELDMIEDLQNNQELSFWVRSIELQECLNGTIGHNLEKTTSNINVSLNDIIAPSDCILGEAAAVTEIKLGFLPVGRTFNTEFTIKNTIKNKGTLTINSDAYLLSLDSKDGFGDIVEKLYKIPNNLIWGYVAYHDENLMGAIASDFQTDLAVITNEKALVEGYYGHFSIDGNAELKMKQVADYQYVKTFYFNHFGINQSLIDLVESYRGANDPTEVEFKIFTTTGEVF